MTQQPPPGHVYRASDDRWYRWPDPTPFDTEDAARAAGASSPSAAPPPQWQPAPQTPGGRVKQKRLGFLPHWRIFTYVILAFNALMLFWIIGGAASTSDDATDCGSLDQATCNAAEDVGAGIAIFGLIVLWALGDIILGIVWLVTRRTQRDCPVCGNDVKKGMVQCPSCGFDFRRQWQGAAT